MPFGWRRKFAFAFLSVLTGASKAMARPLTIVCLGDSTTAGTPFARSPLEKPPAGDGAARAFYGYWIHEAEPDWQALNKGYAGNTTEQILDRIDDALASHPQYVVVLA